MLSQSETAEAEAQDHQAHEPPPVQPVGEHPKLAVCILLAAAALFVAGIGVQGVAEQHGKARAAAEAIG